MRIRILSQAVRLQYARVCYSIDGGDVAEVDIPLPEVPLTQEAFVEAVRRHEARIEVAKERFAWLVKRAGSALDTMVVDTED